MDKERIELRSVSDLQRRIADVACGLVTFDGDLNALADMLHKGCFVVNTALEMAPHDHHDFRDVVTGVFGEIEKCVRDCVAAGQRDGSILTSQPPTDIARLALSTILGLRVLARANPDRELLSGVVRPFFVLLGTR